MKEKQTFEGDFHLLTNRLQGPNLSVKSGVSCYPSSNKIIAMYVIWSHLGFKKTLNMFDHACMNMKKYYKRYRCIYTRCMRYENDEK